MIELEILKSSDPNRLGIIKFFKNELKVGAHISNDVILEQTNLEFSATLDLTNKNQFYFSPKSDIEYHVNKNKINSKKVIKVGDIIEICGTQLKVLSFNYMNPPDKKSLLNKRLGELKEQKSPFLKVLKELKN
ncbi:MAG: hypothetical protein CME65_09255 [Halobacteriovoraceae bacterium]|nr:hypothetical protein [Halobacteriovoraceae bacterium]|tara:strand:- start:23181 stop:23579 length:399 start_codon:yes stop_codon:yes gene_type:complete